MQDGGVQVRRPALLGLALTLVAAPVRAQTSAASGETVVVLPVAADLDPHLLRTLEARVAAGLRRGAFTVVPADEVRAQVPATGCAADCLQRIAATTGASLAVRADVTVAGRDYDVQLVLLRTHTGGTAVTSRELCEICGHEELADRVDDLASALRRKLPAVLESPPRVQVVTQPAGSEVVIDGVVVGVTPLTVDVAAGPHDVMIRRPGHLPLTRPITAAEGATATIADSLAPTPPRRLAPFGWTALALGVGALGAGSALIAIDQQPIRRDCLGDNVDAFGHCKWRHDTLTGGLTLAITGVVAVIAGVTLVVTDRRRQPARSAVRMHGSGLLVRF